MTDPNSKKLERAKVVHVPQIAIASMAVDSGPQFSAPRPLP